MGSESPQVVVGIDVAKGNLDVHLWPTHEAFTLDNTPAGVAQLVDRLRPLPVSLVVLEATGRYERRVAFELMAAGREVAVVSPRQPRDFARASGRLAKTEAIDARTLAQFGAVIGPRSSERPSEDQLLLDGLVGRRRQLVEMITAEIQRRERRSTRRCAARSPSTSRRSRALAFVEDQIGRVIERDDEWRDRLKLL